MLLPSSLSCLFFSPLLPYWTLENFLTEKKKQNKTKSSSHVLFVNIGHWFLLATVNIPLHSVLVKGVSALINSALINLFPNPLLIRRLGYGRCSFRLTVVELGMKLFIKRAQRALLPGLTVLWNDNPYLD